MSLLKNLMVDTKSAWIEYPGLRGFEVEVASIPRAQLIKLRKACMINKFDRKSKQPIETLDEEKYVSEFTKAAIKNWKGLTLEKLEQLMLIDMGKQKPDTEIPFSIEDAEMLVSNSGDFDSWLTEAVFDLENFRSAGAGGTVEPAGKVAE
jgi:hypothetical protein